MSSKREQYIAQCFPAVEYGGKPPGSFVLVQLRMVRNKTAGGIHLADDTLDFQKTQTCLGIVRAVGPIAYCSRQTGDPWPEGAWAKVGQVVMVKRHEGRRFEVPVKGTEDRALFVVLNDNMLDWVMDDDFQDLEKLYDQVI